MEYIMLLDYGYRRSAMNFQHAENENKTAGGGMCFKGVILGKIIQKIRFLVI